MTPTERKALAGLMAATQPLVEHVSHPTLAMVPDSEITRVSFGELRALADAALKVALAGSQPAPATPRDETAWLIESGAGTYWSGRDPIHFGPLDEACRFARQEDAERVRCWLIMHTNRDLANAVRAAEHMWVSK